MEAGEATSEAVLNFVGNMLGVMVGAAIAFATTWLFARRAERDRRLAVGYELFFKAQMAAESVSEIRRVLTQNLDLVGQGHYKHNWQVVELPTGFDWDARCELSPEGLAIFSRVGKFEIINELLELGKLHDLLLILTADFARRQENLMEKLLAETDYSVSGTTVAMLITDDTVKKYSPQLMRVEELLKQILAKAVEGANCAQNLMERLGPELRDALGDKRFRGRIHYVAKTVAKEQ